MKKLKGKNLKKFKNISDWIIYEGYCLVRIKKGGDIENVEDRIAFIEKTPRVQVPYGKVHHGWDGNSETHLKKNFL